MATFDNLKIILEILRNGGLYGSDPLALSICQYENIQFNKTCYHVAYSQADVDELLTSKAVSNIIVLWKRHDGLTKTGRQLLAQQN